MAKNKVKVIVEDENGSLAEFGSKTLTKLFKNKKGQTVKFSIKEPKFEGQFIGTYIVNGITPPPEPTKCPPGQYWDEETKSCLVIPNTAPKCQDLDIVVFTNQEMRIQLVGNDANINDILTFKIETQPTHGALSDINGNEVLYIPPTDFEGVDTFHYSATDNTGLISNFAVVTLTVKQKPPVPDITGLPVDLGKMENFYDSKIYSMQGENRSVTGHHKFDKIDKTTEIAAGDNSTGNPDWEIWVNNSKYKNASGNQLNGIYVLNGARKRLYTWKNESDIGNKNQKGFGDGTLVAITRYIPNNTLENWSGEFFSRHNEEPPNSNKRGGCGCSVYLNSVKFKFEIYHNVHKTIKEFQLAKPLKNGEFVTTADVICKKGTKIIHKKYIDYQEDGSFESVGEVEYDIESLVSGPPSLYNRFRVNGSMPSGVVVDYIKYYFAENFFLTS